MALATVAGLNLLLSVYESFTDSQTLAVANNMFIFKVAGTIRPTFRSPL